MDSDKKQAGDEVAPSRRRFVGTVATGLAAGAAAVPALAQQSAGAANQPPPGRAREAAMRYPAPPFPKQEQRATQLFVKPIHRLHKRFTASFGGPLIELVAMSGSMP